MKKQPERTAHTKQSLIDAFWAVAERRGINDMTIGEITNKAGLNRGTFYVYFESMDDILRQAEKIIIDDFRGRLTAVLEKNASPDFRMITSNVIEILTKYDDKLFLLIGKNGDPEFVYMARTAATEVFGTLLKVENDDPYLDYVIAFVISAFSGLLQFWYETGKELPVEELTGLAHTLALKGMTGQMHNQLDQK